MKIRLTYFAALAFICCISSCKKDEENDSQGPEEVYMVDSSYTYALIPDSVLRYKSIYEYNSNGLKTLYSGSDYNNSLKTWIPSQKQELTFDSEGRQTEIKMSGYNSETKKLEYSIKVETIYNSNGEFASTTDYYFNTDQNLWVNARKNESLYDAKNVLTAKNTYDWKLSQNNWVLVSSEVITTDESTNTEELLGSHADLFTGAWVKNSTKRITKKDAQGNIILSENYNFDFEENIWIGERKWESTFNAVGLQTSSISSNWDINNNNWQKNYKYETTYNAKNLVTSTRDYTWSLVSNSWEENGKTETTYNELGDELTYISYSRNIASEPLMADYRYENTYAADGKKLKSYSYNWNGTTWVKSSLSICYSSKQSVTKLPTNFSIEKQNSIMVSKGEGLLKSIMKK